MPAINPREVAFLALRDSMLCSECELISYNNTAECLACGSRAVLSLSRVLGGSLGGERRALIVAEEPLPRVVEMPPTAFMRRPPMPAAVAPIPSPVAVASGLAGGEAAGITPAHSAMKMVVERAYRLSRCGGAAIATHRGGRMVCEARIGDIAPSLGAEVRGGISALSARTASTLRCDVAEDDFRVDAASCRSLGVKSIVSAPVTNLDRVLGLVTVFSPQPYAFNDRDVAVVQWLAGVMSVVFTGTQRDLSLKTPATTPLERLGRA